MATPRVYAICDVNCRWETLTKEQILTAITQAVNEGTISNIDTGFVQTIKTITGTPLRFFVGTQAEYDTLTEENKENLFAIITNDTTKEGLLAAMETLQPNLEELETKLKMGSIKVGSANLATSSTYATNAYNLISDPPSSTKRITVNGYYYVSVTTSLNGIVNFGLFYWSDVSKYLVGNPSNIKLFKGDYIKTDMRKENKIVWCQPTEMFWNKYVQPIMNRIESMDYKHKLRYVEDECVIAHYEEYKRLVEENESKHYF
jgi:hypothetical protein